MTAKSDIEQQLGAFRTSTRLCSDQERTYHPVFCTTEVSDTQWARFALADPKNPSRRSYIEVVSKPSASSAKIQQQHLESAKTTDKSQPLTDFLHHTPNQVYQYWTHHLRPDDSTPGPYPFSAFTFVIIDEACMNAESMQCIICTIAPDFSQPSSTSVLQSIRVEASRAWDIMVALEELTMTPTECEHWARNPDDEGFSVLNLVDRPPMTVTEVVDENGNGLVRRWVTVGEARENKRKAIQAGESGGWVPLKGFLDGKEGVVYDM